MVKTPIDTLKLINFNKSFAICVSLAICTFVFEVPLTNTLFFVSYIYMSAIILAFKFDFTGVLSAAYGDLLKYKESTITIGLLASTTLLIINGEIFLTILTLMVLVVRKLWIN